MVKLGGNIRQIHLLEHADSRNYITAYPVNGDNYVTRKMPKNSIVFEADEANVNIGKVWINDQQYLDNVLLVAWKFYINGFQPAQKWLKDRFGMKLEVEDIEHYQKIIVALHETDRLMKAVDEVGVV